MLLFGDGSITHLRQMKYFFVEFANGFKHVYNDCDELGGLYDLDFDFKVKGEVCDRRTYGDCCTSDCDFFRSGTCRAEPLRDSFGELWHVIPSKLD